MEPWEPESLRRLTWQDAVMIGGPLLLAGWIGSGGYPPRLAVAMVAWTVASILLEFMFGEEPEADLQMTEGADSLQISMLRRPWIGMYTWMGAGVSVTMAFAILAFFSVDFTLTMRHMTWPTVWVYLGLLGGVGGLGVLVPGRRLRIEVRADQPRLRITESGLSPRQWVIGEIRGIEIEPGTLRIRTTRGDSWVALPSTLPWRETKKIGRALQSFLHRMGADRNASALRSRAQRALGDIRSETSD